MFCIAICIALTGDPVVKMVGPESSLAHLQYMTAKYRQSAEVERKKAEAAALRKSLAQSRLWKSKDDKFSVTASLVRVEGPLVVLSRHFPEESSPDGKGVFREVKVDLKTLSEKDRAWVVKLQSRIKALENPKRGR